MEGPVDSSLNEPSDTDTTLANFIEEVEVEREDSKSPIQEIEDEAFVKVELKNGLEELDEALKSGQLKDIRCCYNNLTRTFPTAVIKTFLVCVVFICFALLCL